MSLESFYGGKQGLSSIIKKSFKYISDTDPAFTILNSEEQAEAIANNEVMAACLSNPDYKDVWYGELCLIDTTNKSNPYNGYLYRRTLAKTGSEDPSSVSGTKLPAEYIGQIVGPAGPALQLESLQSIDEAVAAFNAIPTGTKVTYTDSTGNIHYEKNSSEAVLGVLPIAINGEFIAGNTTATTSSGYIESGKYTWYNVNSGDRSELYLGFQLPYQVNELTAGRTLAPNATPAIRTVTAAPFYNQYAIDTPRGFRGGWISNLRQHTVSGAETYLNLSGLVYNANNDSWSATNTNVTTPSLGQSIWLANFKYQALGQNNNITEQEISNLFVSDSAIVTREGLYVQSGATATMTVSSSVVTDSQIENYINNNNILNNKEQDKAQIVTITFSDNIVESRVFYYNDSQNKWKLLAGGAGGGSANTTDIQLNISGFPNTKTIDPTSGLVFNATTITPTAWNISPSWN